MAKLTTNTIKIATSSEFNPWDASVLPNYTQEYDRPSIPNKWHDIVKLCNFFYERDGLIRTVIDKQVEIGINDMTIVATERAQQRVLELFEYIKNSVKGFLAQAATEYFLSGLVIPDIVWKTALPEETGMKKAYVVPTDIWTRNPLQVELKSTPIPNRVIPLWTLTSDEVSFITNKGVYPDGTEDKETYQILYREFPQYVALVNKGITKIPLPGHFVIRRKPLLRTQYPVPYLMPNLELLMHKRNLRKMDYAVASRVINAILHIKAGNDEHPIGEDSDVLDNLAVEFRRRGSINSVERIVELFSDHTVSLNWVVPPIDTLLNTDKYTQLNQEILYGLGFPKFLITGEKDKSNSGTAGSALLSPLNSMKAMRSDFEDFLNRLFREVADKNNIKTPPLVKFAPLDLIEMQDLLSVAQTLEEKGIVSRTNVAKLAGFDFVSEQHLRYSEEELMTELFGGEEENVQDDNPEQQVSDQE